jgi:hypothetical protein
MRRLPPYHVPRPRLTERCAQERLVVVEAAGGYGKSVLSAELVDSWEAVGVEVELEAGGVSAALLASRLRAAVGRAGFIEAANAAADAGEDHVGAVEAMLAALAAERAAIVIDDAHHADPGAAALIDHIAATLVAEQRLVVLARQLPDGAQRLRRAEFHHLDSADLALRADETLAVCRSGFGLEVGDEAADALERATGGWTAATVLAAARARRTGEAVEAVAQAADRPNHPADTVAALLEEATIALGLRRRRCSHSSRDSRCSIAGSSTSRPPPRASSTGRSPRGCRSSRRGAPGSTCRARSATISRRSPRRRSMGCCAPPRSTHAATSSARRCSCCSAPASPPRRRSCSPTPTPSAGRPSTHSS